MSLEDCITDVLYEPALLEDWVTPPPGPLGPFHSWAPPPLRLTDQCVDLAAHSGFLEVATAIVEDIDEQGVLHHVLYEQEGGLLNKGWDVVVTGHSLGAGLASLVGLYFRKFLPEYVFVVFFVVCLHWCLFAGLLSSSLCKRGHVIGDACARILLPPLPYAPLTSPPIRTYAFAFHPSSHSPHPTSHSPLSFPTVVFLHGHFVPQGAQ